MARSPSEQIFDSLMVSARLPRAELEKYTSGALAQIVGHAQRTVPFYRDRLAGVLRPDGTIDRDAWQRVEPLSRSDLQNNFEALKSTQIPPGHGEISERSTSGTTGKPVTVLITDRTKATEVALMGRFYAWTGLDPSRNLVILQGGRHPLLDYRQVIPEPWFPDWLAGQNFGGYSRLHYPIGAEEQAAYLAGQGPIYFNTQPSNFRRVLYAIRDGSGPKPDIRGIISLGELVTGDDRELARDVVGCEIFDTYSATDVGTIASQCSHGSLHVNSEIVCVEIVRADASPCGEGEEGRILATTLANGAMPLLRYDIGDIGMLGGACGCGLSLPELTLTVGRERQLFRFSDGSVVLPIFRMEKFSEIFPVSQWQLVQTGPESVELRFSSQAADEQLRFDEIAEAIRLAFGRPLEVSFRRSESEMTGQSGKLEPVMRRF